MTGHNVESSTRCTWCDGLLSCPAEALAVVHGDDGRMMMTCSTDCLAELVAALTGQAADDRRVPEARRH
jgi:hypothetical protein